MQLLVVDIYLPLTCGTFCCSRSGLLNVSNWPSGLLGLVDGLEFRGVRGALTKPCSLRGAGWEVESDRSM